MNRRYRALRVISVLGVGPSVEGALAGAPKMRRFLLIAAIFFGACGGTPTTQGPGGETQETEKTPAASRCIDVPQDLVDGIASGLTVQGGGSLRGAAAVKSNDFQSLYFISADLQGSGLEGSADIATWATNRLEAGAGLILSVDAVAKEFSQWPDGSKTDAKTSSSDDGVAESRACAASRAET